MAKCCIECGKNIGMFTDRIELLEGEDVVICGDCYDKIPSIVDELHKYRIFPDKKELFEIKGDVVQKMKNSCYKQESIEYVSKFIDEKISRARQDIEEDNKIREVELAILKEKKKDFKMTTGYDFEGYSIIEYKDIISSEVVLGTGFFTEITAKLDDLFGETSSPFENKLSQAKSIAKDKLMIHAISLDANALIGVDFDIMTISTNMIVVSANGTAVILEPAGID